MTDYRGVVRHVRYWRGNPHKWSTVWPFTGTFASSSYNSVCVQLHAMEQAVNYVESGGGGGGVYEVALYDQASGGVPVQVISYFDPEIPGDWIAYTGSAWTTTGEQLVSAAEVALQVEWPGGLSSSGKPVAFRKWFHSVPANPSTPPAPDVSTADKGTLASAFEGTLDAIGGLGAPMGRGGRLAATTPVISSFFGNHQMPRGRRKPPTRISGAAFGLPPGLLTVPGSDGSV